MDKKEIRWQAIGFGCLFIAICVATALVIRAYAIGSSAPQYETVEELLEANRQARGEQGKGTKGSESEPESKTYSINYDIDGEIVLQSIARYAGHITNGARANLVTTIKGQRVNDELKFSTVTSVSRDRYKNEMPLEFYIDAEGNQYHGCKGFWQQDGKQSIWSLDALRNVEGATLQVVQRPGIFQYRIVLDGEQSMSLETFGLVLRTMALQAEYVNSDMWTELFSYFDGSEADIKLEFVFDREANLTGIEFRTNDSINIVSENEIRDYTENFLFKIKLTRLTEAEPIDFTVPNDYGAGQGVLGLHSFDRTVYQANKKQVSATMGTVMDTHIGTTVGNGATAPSETQSATVSGSETVSKTGEIDWGKVLGVGTADLTPVDEYRPQEINTGYSEALEKLGSSRMDEIVSIMLSGKTGKMDAETAGTYNGTELKTPGGLDWGVFERDGWEFRAEENKGVADTDLVRSLTATNSKYPGVRMEVKGDFASDAPVSKESVKNEGFKQFLLSIQESEAGEVPPFDFAGFKLNYSGAELPVWVAGGEVQGDQSSKSGVWSYMVAKSDYMTLFNIDCGSQKVRSVQLILR